jgi:cobalt-zinc-cadmium resistance protein CzcA
MPPSISLESQQRLRQRMRRHQELSGGETVVSQHGRPDDGTDATGFFNAEFFVPLKPFDTWPSGIDKAKLTKQIKRRARGRSFPASTSISRRTSRTMSKRPRPA